MENKGTHTNLELSCGPTKTKVRLLKKIATGGEGEIYNVDIINSLSKAHIGKKYVAKIYLKNSNLYRSKIQYMIQYASGYDKFDQHKFYKYFNETILWPLCALDKNDNFMGYNMKLFAGEKLSNYFLVPLSVAVSTYFVGWKKVDFVKLALDITKKVSFLHQNNIVLGDIDLDNIMIDLKSRKSAVVDTDSFQIGSFLCTVAHADSAPPEIHFMQKTGDIKRKKRLAKSDNFSLAIVIFQILMMGHHPYQYKNASNSRSSEIDNGNFRYPTRTDDIKRFQVLPSYEIAAIWSHLPKYIRKKFFNTFSKIGDNYKLDNRLSSKAWVYELEHYINDLSSIDYLKFDQEANSIVPKKIKLEINTWLYYYYMLNFNCSYYAKLLVK